MAAKKSTIKHVTCGGCGKKHPVTLKSKVKIDTLALIELFTEIEREGWSTSSTLYGYGTKGDYSRTYFYCPTCILRHANLV